MTLFLRWMQLRSKFQPLDERLTSVRSLSLVRMAVPVKIDPMLVCYTFYYTCSAEGHVVYATDQRVGVHVTPMGKFCLNYYKRGIFANVDSRFDAGSYTMGSSARIVQLGYLPTCA